MEKSFFDVFGWKDVLELLCKKLDFRDLLRFKLTCKAFLAASNKEIQRREQLIRDSQDFYSDQLSWFLARRCVGIIIEKKYKHSARLGRVISYETRSVRTRHHITCERFEEITLLGENSFCRRCLKIKENTDREQLELKALFLQEERIRRIKETRLRQLQMAQNEEKEMAVIKQNREQYIKKHGGRGLIMGNGKQFKTIIKTKNANEL
jgi:hypothetical protein